MATTRNSMNRKFGVEFEVGNEVSQEHISNIIKCNSVKEVIVSSGWAPTIDNKYWHVKYDRTCGSIGQIKNEHGKSKYADHGWEIASFVASNENDLNHIAFIGKKLAEGDCLVNPNCGFHIHCNVDDFTGRDMGVLLARWIKIEPMLCNLMPNHRVDNYFCRLLSKSRKIAKGKKHMPEDVWQKLKPTQYGPHENRQKKVTLNTVNVAAAYAYENSFYPFDPPSYLSIRKTVEFRMPEGSLNSEAVFAWVRFFLRFVEMSKKSKMPDNLLPIKKIKEFFTYCGLSNVAIKNDDNMGLFDTKLFLIERLFLFADEETKKQFEKGLF